MRWRLCLIFLSATALFCFMLLTAVTDYGVGGSAMRPAPLVSAIGNGGAPLGLSAARPTPAAPVSTAPQQEKQFLTPAPTRLFVPADADPVMARRQEESEERLNRGKPSNRRRLRLDENGWYREEVAMVTAYCPCVKCCGSSAIGITSIGKNAWTPGLAADPEYLGYGTTVFVPGYGLSNIDDTGGAMRRHWRRNGVLHIDVRMTYHYEARQWGKQYLRVKIYDHE